MVTRMWRIYEWYKSVVNPDKKSSAYNDTAEQPEQQEVPDDPEDVDQTDDIDEQGGLTVLWHTFQRVYNNNSSLLIADNIRKL